MGMMFWKNRRRSLPEGRLMIRFWVSAKDGAGTDTVIICVPRLNQPLPRQPGGGSEPPDAENVSIQREEAVEEHTDQHANPMSYPCCGYRQGQRLFR